MASFRRRNKIAIELPTAAMSDVAFLLIVFFVVTTSFQGTHQLNVELPGEATSESTEPPPEPPRVRLSADKLELNGQPVAVWQLTTDLQQILYDRTEPEQRVVIFSADDELPMGSVVEVMDAIRLAEANVGYLEVQTATNTGPN
jgi:biopolymer transport protein ExbD